jgi:hypothetical protein
MTFELNFYVLPTGHLDFFLFSIARYFTRDEVGETFRNNFPTSRIKKLPGINHREALRKRITIFYFGPFDTWPNNLACLSASSWTLLVEIKSKLNKFPFPPAAGTFSSNNCVGGDEGECKHDRAVQNFYSIERLKADVSASASWRNIFLINHNKLGRC